MPETRYEAAVALLKRWSQGERPFRDTFEFLADEVVLPDRPTDPITATETPEAKRLSSGTMPAVHLPKPGHADRIAEILEEGKPPPPTKPKPSK